MVVSQTWKGLGTKMNDQMKLLHTVWNQTTGQELHFKATERLFYELWKMEFKPDDLLCVLKHVLAYNKTHTHAPMKIQIHKLCGDLEIFASILAEARAKDRNRVKPATPKESVLSEWRGIKPESNGNARSIGEFIKVPQ